MKQYIPILLSLALIGCSAPVTAHKEDVKVTQQVSEQEDKVQLSNQEKQYCNSLYEFAEVAMQVRQNGMSLKDALAKAPQPNTQAEKEIVHLLHAILYDAYEQPLYHTEEYKKEIVTEFSKDVYLACIGG